MMYYTKNEHAVGISKSGDVFVLSPDELEVLSEIKRTKYSTSSPVLAEMFPQASTSIKNIIKEKRAKILELREEGWWWKGWVNKQPMAPASKEMYSTLLCEIHSSYPISELEKEIESLEKVLMFIKMKNEGKEDKGKANLELAKNVPITNFVEFNRGGFSRCLFHQEKSPSMKYDKKTNRVYCFGSCSKGYDVVDVVQKLFNYSFIDAIKFLSK